MTDWQNSVLTGDTFDVLPTLPEASVHAVVTDPPYGLAFMGRDWDAFEPREYQEWCAEWASAVKRVLKPGGHLLAFSGNRTHHRLFSGVEDAGFEIRDTVTWHYGSGFPKALDVSKAIDKAADAEREVVGDGEYTDRKPNGSQGKNSVGYMGDDGGGYEQTAPATDAAERLDAKNSTAEGWGESTNGDAEGNGSMFGIGGRNSGRYDMGGGGPSRFFYTSKASKAERTEGGSITNDHPTVKPLDLAEWLVRLVTAEGQVVLDPFAGSGTIPKAAKQLGRQFVGIEQQPRYADVARVRCGLTPEDPSAVRSDDDQRGLEVFGE